MKNIKNYFFILYIILLAFPGFNFAQDTIYVYGPGGPAPAMKDAADLFGKSTGIKVIVTAGPTPQWLNKAKHNADIIYSGSENMMTDFVNALDGKIVDSDVQPLYIRPLSLLVRPGNPKKISGIKDILKTGVKILVVNGAGLTGAWEDMAGRKGDLKTVKLIRKNIVSYAKNSAEAKQQWINNPEIDVWIIWNIWQVSNPNLADVVSIEPDYAIYRPTDVVLTTLGKTKDTAKKFIEYLNSSDGEMIFKKWGWTR
ncbi:MAG: ABC transporter substrate-binding protein [Ignavibacteriales bacterium CG_4_9_14_3_um_filter_34_10]|nr:MAG: ABC transporter substrate-binding protein [Ignavibacteriales bacterium CG_4_9_14_3_um_filter_34_10]